MMARVMKMLTCTVLLLPVVVFGGCSQKKPPVRKPVVARTQPPPQVAATPAEEKKEAPEVYDYESRGRRDPFTSLIAIAKEKQKRKKSSNPMENFDVSEIKLTATVWDKNHYYASITLPDGKSYTITKGMTLGLYGGKVEEITRDSVLVREEVRDYRGQLKTKDTILRLRKEGEE